MDEREERILSILAKLAWDDFLWLVRECRAADWLPPHLKEHQPEPVGDYPPRKYARGHGPCHHANVHALMIVQAQRWFTVNEVVDLVCKANPGLIRPGSLGSIRPMVHTALRKHVDYFELHPSHKPQRYRARMPDEPMMQGKEVLAKLPHWTNYGKMSPIRTDRSEPAPLSKVVQDLKQRDNPSAGPWVICPHCGDRMRSEYRHDYKHCKCGKSMVDGGSAYLRSSLGILVEGSDAHKAWLKRRSAGEERRSADQRGEAQPAPQQATDKPPTPYTSPERQGL